MPRSHTHSETQPSWQDAIRLPRESAQRSAWGSWHGRRVPAGRSTSTQSLRPGDCAAQTIQSDDVVPSTVDAGRDSTCACDPSARRACASSSARCSVDVQRHCRPDTGVSATRRSRCTVGAAGVGPSGAPLPPHPTVAATQTAVTTAATRRDGSKAKLQCFKTPWEPPRAGGNASVVKGSGTAEVAPTVVGGACVRQAETQGRIWPPTRSNTRQ